jgi:hypothetical protein
MLGTENHTNVAIPARRRRRATMPEQTLAGIRHENPNASPNELREIARQYVIENSEFEHQASRDFTLWLVDKALLHEIKEPKPEAKPEVIRAERAALKARLTKTMQQYHETLIADEVKIRLLEYETTYGKALGDCTGAECERLSRRYGDFFFELAKRLTRSETVRAHLSEVEVQAIARSHRLIGEKAAR